MTLEDVKGNCFDVMVLLYEVQHSCLAVLLAA